MTETQDKKVYVHPRESRAITRVWLKKSLSWETITNPPNCLFKVEHHFINNRVITFTKGRFNSNFFPISGGLIHELRRNMKWVLLTGVS